ncbi:MAG: hypothetical protein RIC54_23825 [Thalassobaculum sp.]|uniref:hypothetical protein n=1 Tax=Thalassobaculum sp. TaxID=2022740 RepID=UPI0032EB8225
MALGIAMLLMAIVVGTQDPLDFDPDPLLQGLVWFGFSVACFMVAWSLRGWRRPPE